MKTIFTEHPALMIVLQSVVLLALAFAVINVLMARRSAGTRHLAWVFSMGALLALPALWQVLPGWGVFPSPGGAASPTVTETDDGPAFVPALARTPAFDDLAPAATPKIPATDPVLLPPAIPDEGAKTSYLEWLGAIWLAGVGILLVRLLLSRLFLAFAARKARLVTRGPLFEEVESVRAKIGIGRKIRLCLSPATAGKTMPMTWGVFRPVLILPTEIEDWGSERTAVLQHELAHIRRWDAATHLLVQTACALYWFNPLVWLAARRIHLERERACDDFVLRSQAVKPSAYADCLLRILTGLDAGRLGQNATAIAIAMSAPGKSQLEKRLQTITADGIDRRPVSTWSFALVLLAVVSLVLPVAMLRAADEKEKNPKPIKEKSVSPEPAAVEPKVLDPVPAIVSGDFDGDRDLDVYINQKNGRFRMLEDGQVVLVEASHKKGEAPLVGIGVVLQESDDGIKVGRILENSPASESGLEVHDRLTGVAQGENGKMIDVRDLDLVSLVQLIRGREGSKVRLRLISADGGDEAIVTVARSALNLKEEGKSDVPLPGTLPMVEGVIRNEEPVAGSFESDARKPDPDWAPQVKTIETQITAVTTQTETSTSRRKGAMTLELEIRDIPLKKVKATEAAAMINHFFALRNFFLKGQSDSAPRPSASASERTNSVTVRAPKRHMAEVDALVGQMERDPAALESALGKDFGKALENFYDSAFRAQTEAGRLPAERATVFQEIAVREKARQSLRKTFDEDHPAIAALNSEIELLDRLAAALGSFRYPDNGRNRITVWRQSTPRSGSFSTTHNDDEISLFDAIDAFEDRCAPMDKNHVAAFSESGARLEFMDYEDPGKPPRKRQLKRGQLVILLAPPAAPAGAAPSVR